MILVVCCFLLSLSGSYGEPAGDQYMDNILQVSLQRIIKIKQLDPVALSDYWFEYYDKTFFGKVKGIAEYTSGSVSGLSQVLRQDNCVGPRNFTHFNYTSISCSVKLNELNTQHQGKVKYGKLPKVSITAKSKVEPTLLHVEIIKYYDKKTPFVKVFDIEKLGHLNVKLSGLGPLNKYMKILEENYTKQMSYDLSTVLNNKFRNALNEAVSDAPMPIS